MCGCVSSSLQETILAQSPFCTSSQRRGDYLGKTVQVIPHVTDAVQDWIERIAATPVDESEEQADVCIIEVGCPVLC